MKMNTDDMNFEELKDWMAGYILKELIAGRLRPAQQVVATAVISWFQNQQKSANSKNVTQE